MAGLRRKWVKTKRHVKYQTELPDPLLGYGRHLERL